MENWFNRSSKNAWGDSIKAFKLGKRLKSLPQSFYERDTLQVARELLGKVLVVRSAPQYALDDPRALVTASRIVETEAYHGSDPASHCSRGETPRCAIMFGKPGVAYVYFIYGMYEMLNFVTERKGYPGAVLIRAVEPIFGQKLMQKRRLLGESQWTNGPGRLCQALGIELAHNGQGLKGPELFVVDSVVQGFELEQVSISPRVGISKGTEQYWRYFITDNRFVSRSPQNKLSRLEGAA